MMPISDWIAVLDRFAIRSKNRLRRINEIY